VYRDGRVGQQLKIVLRQSLVDVPPVISSVVAPPNVLRPPNKKRDLVTILVKDTDVVTPIRSAALALWPPIRDQPLLEQTL
jgi:hypothetical protein